MKPNFTITGLALLFLCGVMSIQIQPASAQVSVIESCGCGNTACDGGCGYVTQDCCDCGGCRGRRAKRRCPECECEFCTLEVKETEVEKTCFKTEQKIICVPKVRMPWQKCCPGTSKTKTITVLKKHKYKCPSCKYTWSVNEPELTFAKPADETVPPIVTPGASDPSTNLIRPYQPPVLPLQNSAPTYVTPNSSYPSTPAYSYENQNLRGIHPAIHNTPPAYQKSGYQVPPPSR